MKKLCILLLSFCLPLSASFATSIGVTSFLGSSIGGEVSFLFGNKNLKPSVGLLFGMSEYSYTNTNYYNSTYDETSNGIYIGPSLGLNYGFDFYKLNNMTLGMNFGLSSELLYVSGDYYSDMNINLAFSPCIKLGLYSMEILAGYKGSFSIIYGDLSSYFVIGLRTNLKRKNTSGSSSSTLNEIDSTEPYLIILPGSKLKIVEP